MNRQGKVFVNEIFAGIVFQDDEGYGFKYDKNYLEKYLEPVSLTLPLRENAYRSKTMLPFFDGLIPEGWLLKIAEKNWKLNEKDRMGLLLSVCKDNIGNVSVESISKND